MPTRPIGELCTDPWVTRALAARRRRVPCYRCIAWDGNECFFVANGTPRPIATPEPEADQLDLFPTPDTLDRDTEET